MVDSVTTTTPHDSNQQVIGSSVAGARPTLMQPHRGFETEMETGQVIRALSQTPFPQLSDRWLTGLHLRTQKRYDRGSHRLGVIRKGPMAAVLEDDDFCARKSFLLPPRISGRNVWIVRAPEDERR